MADLKRGGVYRFSSLSKNRMAVVLTRQAVIPYLHHVTVVPVTTTIRDIPSEVKVGEADGFNEECVFNCDHLLTVPQKNAGTQVTNLSEPVMNEIKHSLNFALDFN